MTERAPALPPAAFANFGALLRHLRRQARLTQRELAIAVGYSESQISRLEQGERLPDLAMLRAQFVPALGLEHELAWVDGCWNWPMPPTALLPARRRRRLLRPVVRFVITPHRRYWRPSCICHVLALTYCRACA